METITPQAIRDFMVCPLFFEYKHITQERGIYKRNEVYAERYLNVMRRVVSLFFHKKQANDKITYHNLVKKWEKNWFPKELSADTLAYGSVSNDNITGLLIHYNSLAIAALERFHHLFSTDFGVPVVINEDRVVQVTDNLRVKIPLDLVLQYKEGTKRVVKWRAGQPRFGRHDQMLEFAAIYLAMKADGSYKPGTVFSVYDFHAHNAKMKRFDLTEDDIRTFIFWAQQITDRKEYPVPQRGFTPFCGGCSYDTKCKNYSTNLVRGEYDV